VTRLSETYGDKHPDMVGAKETLLGAEEKLRSECQSYVRSLQGEYQVAASQEATLAASLDSAKRKTLDSSGVLVELGVLRREVANQKALVESLMSRAKETGLETELKSTNVRIVERAEPPGGPFLPQRTRNLRLALLLGLALGIGLTLLFEQLDNTIKTPDDVKEQLNLPFLGMVPDVGGKGPQGGSRPSPLILKSPQSAVAEAYRVVRTNLVFSLAEGKGRVFVVSSANAGEGKTTTTANLASSLALSGSRVLAVDADLRRPTMHQHFGVPKAPGLSDLIVGKSQPSEAIQDTRFKGLQVLPCGYIPPNPAELLSSPAMRQIITALRAHYDFVLIDSPPILAMADTPVLASLVDGLVLVMAAEVTSRPSIQRAVDQLQKVNGKIIGVVLNKVNLERNSYYYSQYYGEYYRSYYVEKQAKARGESGPRGVSDEDASPRPQRRR
jgi:succinoglycan biosynthesis transport protein ExoP